MTTSNLMKNDEKIKLIMQPPIGVSISSGEITCWSTCDDTTAVWDNSGKLFSSFIDSTLVTNTQTYFLVDATSMEFSTRGWTNPADTNAFTVTMKVVFEIDSVDYDVEEYTFDPMQVVVNPRVITIDNLIKEGGVITTLTLTYTIH